MMYLESKGQTVGDKGWWKRDVGMLEKLGENTRVCVLLRIVAQHVW